MIWFTADWHLGEDRFHLIQRPFTSVEHHLESIIENHNNLVKKDDEIVVVGDAVYQKKPEYIKHISRFNGKKTLVRGNHDRIFSDRELFEYFDRVIPDGEGLELEIDEIPCYAVHYPSQGRKDRFNLIGHIHSTWKYQLNMFNVGVDVNHFRPVPSDKIKFHLEAIKFYDLDVWIAYNEINSSYYGKRGKNESYFIKDLI